MEILLYLLLLFSYSADTNSICDSSTRLIASYEGFRSEAYLDTSGRYSIGYGTRSYPGENISEGEAFGRLKAVVNQSVSKIMKDFPGADENQIVALTSLYFNCGSGYKRVLGEGPEVWKDEKFCTLPGYSGLITRRAEERRLYFGTLIEGKDK